MKYRALVILGVAALAAGCIAPADRLGYQPGAAITRGEGVQAFSDAVLGHCLPAIETGQDFRDFEKKGVMPLRKLEKNRISRFEDDSHQVWQLVDAVVQLQLVPGRECRVSTYGLPVKTTFDIVGNGILASEYGYSEEDVGYPQPDLDYRRVFTSGFGEDQVTVILTGNEPAQDGSGDKYGDLDAVITRGPVEW